MFEKRQLRVIRRIQLTVEKGIFVGSDVQLRQTIFQFLIGMWLEYCRNRTIVEFNENIESQTCYDFFFELLQTEWIPGFVFLKRINVTQTRQKRLFALHSRFRSVPQQHRTIGLNLFVGNTQLIIST